MISPVGPSGRLALRTADFTAAVDGFADALLATMEERISFIARTGWKAKDVALDIRRLVAEQRSRRTDVSQVRERVSTRPPTDWSKVRSLLDQLCQRLETEEE